jgi:hypothetical protein
VVEHLPSTCKALDSNHSTTKKMVNGDHTEQIYVALEHTVVPVWCDSVLNCQISKTLHCRLSSELEHGMPIGVGEFIRV